MYLPFLNGLYSVAPGLLQTSKIAAEYDRKMFQLDEEYERYLGNKANCRSENIGKYVFEQDLPSAAAVRINRFIANRLVEEHPSVFSIHQTDAGYSLLNEITATTISWNNDWLSVSGGPWLNLFDALCSQVQEDFAVCLLQDDANYIAALHLCSPNYWSPGTKIGQDFASIHEIVPGMEKMRPHYPDMLRSIVQKGPFTRFAWGLSTDTRLNHHPDPPEGVAQVDWYGRDFGEGCKLFIRTERQSIVGFPELEGFLFTIRTYFYPVAELGEQERKMLYTAICSMSEASKEYKGLKGHEAYFQKILSN